MHWHFPRSAGKCPVWRQKYVEIVGMRGEVGKENNKKETHFYDVTHDTKRLSKKTGGDFSWEDGGILPKK